MAEVLEGACYQALCGIQRILKTDYLSDEECFQRIEDIIHVLESIGVTCGSRHDF